jgi:hypothetical protein
MDFSFSEEQSMLRDLVAGYLRDHYDFEARQKAMASDAGWRPEVWQAFAREIGVLGASLPESAGGLGGGAVENLIVMEELGSALFIEPYLEAVILAGALLKRSSWAEAEAWLGRIGSGEALLAFAHAEPGSRYDLADVCTTARKAADGWILNGRKSVVHAAPWSTHLLVSARVTGERRDRTGVAVFLVDKAAPGVLSRDYPTVDGRRASEIQFEDVQLTADRLVAGPDTGLAVIERAVDEAVCGACAEASGVLRRMHRDTIDYAKQRRQFGRPIADFQVLQHRMVDMLMAIEQAVSATWFATLMLDGEPAARARAVSSAKVLTARACRYVGQEAIQIHGGIGMTDELALGWYFKRATVIEGLYGDADHHLERFAAAG